MKFSTVPEPLSATLVEDVVNYLKTLFDETLPRHIWVGSPDHISIFVDGKPRPCYAYTYFDIGDSYVYLGKQLGNDGNSNRMPLLDQLGIVRTLISLLPEDQQSELVEPYMTVLAKVLAGQWCSLVKPFTTAPVPLESLALTSGKIAGLFEGEWLSPTGQPAEVDDTWTILKVPANVGG